MNPKNVDLKNFNFNFNFNFNKAISLHTLDFQPIIFHLPIPQFNVFHCITIIFVFL